MEQSDLDFITYCEQQCEKTPCLFTPGEITRLLILAGHPERTGVWEGRPDVDVVCEVDTIRDLITEARARLPKENFPVIRSITTHVVYGDDPNNQLRIESIDAAGAGGAYHAYMIRSPDASNIHFYTNINFQNGPIKEKGVNGVTQEALLAIVIDRLRSFQAGPFSCRENAIALTHCEDAMMWLQRRTVDRLKRGVEGTNKA